MFTDKIVNSPLLGISFVLNEEGREKLKLLVEKSPLAVFQVLNKRLNEGGLCVYFEQFQDIAGLKENNA